MLSRRDKLLIQPWEDRRFRDHRYKVQSVLPTVDTGPPAPRPHVAVKLKKWRRELDRTEQVRRDNAALLQRLGAIMRVNRLDNHWEKPLPSLHQKVGLFMDADALRSRLARASSSAGDVTSVPVRCLACHVNKKTSEYNKKMYSNGRDYSLSLPSIY
ncbi:uncharacterized protein LOC119694606 [Plutella xylostella]|uniref:uncharacterized protein LOC119694606 n=1 Tax=Plutella xylostella TaxID=51655 RepID=UPI002032BBC3|nr:uncharacterized protein LOC119694606 [Plutella xylostella]